ncbi:MAG: non-homologous end-joining DNA ligase [Chlamydiia bacterium]|nr:non-homologous end-joining DNA ligase [Chlamydiia bacterium]
MARLEYQPPMLATLTKTYFSDPQWIFEKKFDGVRCIVVKREKKVTLYSRNRKILNVSFPELVKAFEGQNGSFVVDGEIVAASFSKLQERLHVKDPKKVKRSIRVVIYLFDLLNDQGTVVTKLPLLERKKHLKKRIQFKGGIRYTSHRKSQGEKFLKEACKKNWEGLIAKKAEGKYVHKRSRDWLKFKCVKGETFVICGYTQPQGSRVGFGALLIGYPGKGKLRYAGKVGTGYDTALLKKLGARLARIQRQTSPFKDPKVPSRGVTWVQPKIKVKVGFTERTKEGRLRHPRFLEVSR